MKKIIFAFFALINFSFVFAAGWPEPHQENTTFYQNCKNIDQNTYSIIYGSYGKDKSGVYYGCDKMGIKYPNNFKVLNFGKYKSKLEGDVSSYFASDDYYIYQGNSILTGSDIKSFRYLDGPWFTADDSHLYCRGGFQIFDGINGPKLQIKQFDNTMYITDGNSIILTPDAYCQNITGVDAKSRKPIIIYPETIYSKDSKYIYKEGSTIQLSELGNLSAKISLDMISNLISL